jgi:cytidine deaminase
MEKKIVINYQEYSSIKELNTSEVELVERAKKATNNSYAPYSTFQVGAALLLENGEIISASNQENCAYPSGICAERNAIFYANHKYPKSKVKAIAIAAFTNGEYTNEPVSPCGACRQVLLETETRLKNSMDIILYGKNRILKAQSIKDLLPFTFDGELL